MKQTRNDGSDDWVIRFRPLPHGKGEPDGVQRMRRLLKCALRSFGFRVVDAKFAPRGPGLLEIDEINAGENRPQTGSKGP